MTSQKGVETRILILEDGQHQESTLYRLKKGWQLEFRVGASLFGRKVTIFTNFPDKGKQFSRNFHRCLEWSKPEVDDDFSSSVLEMSCSGSFHFYFTCDDKEAKCGSGYFAVDPVLECGSEIIPLHCIQCVTYLSKNLGPFCDWEKKLQVAKECGYNMIHFTPIQELGSSNSAYSLSDQLSINVEFSDSKKFHVKIEEIAKLLEKIRNEWKMMSICDIVLNHTANESLWLQDHPECSYNMVNSPHLKPAYVMDIALHNLNKEIATGMWELNGIPSHISQEQHLEALKHALLETILPKIRLEEYFIVPVDSLMMDFLALCRNHSPPTSNFETPADFNSVKIIQDPLFRRLKSSVDLNVALNLYNNYRYDCFDEETRVQKCASDFKACLEKLNDSTRNIIKSHLTCAVNNIISGVRYFRVQHDGPKMGQTTEKNSLFTRYFTDFNNEPKEDHAHSDKGCFIMAHNGWIINTDPLLNFAGPNSQAYLRRELISWEDSVKLRYGNKPEDCPYLWNRMRKYVEETARTFDGVRLDNCHSTPFHVAEYLLDAARLIRPNLYVVAELFTNSDLADNIYVNRLGINSFIRESMSAWNSHELGRLVYRYGGDPIGAFFKPFSRLLVPSIAHALFMDLSHDNPSPIEKRCVFDCLPSSALVAMACCASGSTMGYDLLVPHHINVVDEKRKYGEWGKDVTENSGIIKGKKALNNLHTLLGKGEFYQVFVDQVDSDIVCVTRHNDLTRESIILISYTAFNAPQMCTSGEGKGVTITGCVEKVLIEAFLQHKSGERFVHENVFVKNDLVINGLTDYNLVLKENITADEATMINFSKINDNSTRVNFTNQFKSGSIVIIRFAQNKKVGEALNQLSVVPDTDMEIKLLSLAAINKILYCCDSEDGGTYKIPNFSPLVYCGFQGIVSLMDIIAFNNDLGHPICHNLRDGDWLIDYTINRLKSKIETRPFAEKLEIIFKPIKDIPRYLVPCYFYFILSHIYQQIIEIALSSMSKNVNNGSEFCKLLALGSVQMGGIVDSSPLPLLSKNLRSPVPPLSSNGEMPLCVSLAAGLPHFAVGYVRNWGRDTFISLKGLFLLTGRYEEARYIILAYAGCLRHGLIPNLLDGGRNARYNCRDAVWWWLYIIKNYVSMVPNGEKILCDKVNRLYPTDDSPICPTEQTLQDVIQEAMNKHFQGLCFRERNAGTAIDAHMKSAGFDNQIGIHPVTGFVFGGNEWNCGTWMDKMGSSSKAGNKGKPATPRDGSAIELVALCKSAVSWLAYMNELEVYPYSGVTRRNNGGTEITWSYFEWSCKIQENFEKHFWIEPSVAPEELRPDLVHRRSIFKDCYGATQPWSDYQLRCNFPVAMVIAPELFNPVKAWKALEIAKHLLLGPLGMKTLDPDDWAYNGVYNNDDDSTNPKTAHGFNYHQGPEWVWPVGYFLRARMHFASKLANKVLLKNVVAECKSSLANHYTHLKKSSDWRGLPELTNENGAFCPFSNPTQAWSMASILEAAIEISTWERFCLN